MEVRDKVILITGGGKGIGRECTRLFAQQGNKVIITGRTEQALKETSEALNAVGGKVSYLVGDVTVREDCERIVETVAAEHGRLDVLINNAGMSSRGFFAETTLDLFEKVMAINFMGAVTMTKFALPHITKQEGSIVFISSLSGMKGLPGIAPYGTAKMALTGFSDSLRTELFAGHVHVGILNVGFTENDSNKTVFDADGSVVPIPKRKNYDTQENVAKAVYRCVKQRKNKLYLTAMGKATKLFYQFFPGLADAILNRFAAKTYLKKRAENTNGD